MFTLFKSLAETLEKVEATRSRLKIKALAADFLRTLDPDEVEPAVSLMLGRAFSKSSGKKLEVSWNTLSTILQRVTGADRSILGDAFSQTGDIGSASKAVFEQSKMQRQALLLEKPLTITEVRRSLEAIADAEGSGSRERKERLITALLSQASPIEAKFLVKVFVGEMRTGFYEGLMEQAVAKAFGVSLMIVQRAGMVLGDIGEVAYRLKTEGALGLENVRFVPFRPVKLMLAQVCGNVDSALKEHGGETAFEYKYDGARVQIHKLGGTVRVFSRRLTDVTLSLPEIVNEVKSNLLEDAVIVEGEIVAVDSSGMPILFQHLMRRFRRVHGITREAKKIPLTLFLFDVLYLNGKSLIQRPYAQRRLVLAEIAGEIPLAAQLVTASPVAANAFLESSVEAGHEGLMAKKLSSPYRPGARGKLWLKIKTILEPLDLVITAAEWGSGRRHGWLSDYYLSARDVETGEFVTLGKSFKGLTDTEIIELTKQLKEIKIKDEGHRVVVLPKIVVQVAYNEIQQSPKYTGKMALRFARITRVREDKSPEQADTIQHVKEIYERQFTKKGRYKTI